MDIQNKKIVCLGGGIGSVNLIKGLKQYSKNIAIAFSMADDGGSAGRLRRLYNIFPPGDIVSCMAAMQDNDFTRQLLTYRFPGDRYGKDEELSGHKLGSLIFVAMRDVLGDFTKAIEQFQKTFKIPGTFLPATEQMVNISIKTKDGNEVFGEQTVDLGDYDWKVGIDQIFLHPENISANQELINGIQQADVILAGPGDLFTTLLPVLIVPGIKEALQKSKATKMYIVNVTNKPFETKNYTVLEYMQAIQKHLGFFPFEKVIVNNNHSVPITQKYDYAYVDIKTVVRKINTVFPDVQIVEGDVVDNAFPLYHDPKKLAKLIRLAI